jgi:protein SCO1
MLRLGALLSCFIFGSTQTVLAHGAHNHGAVAATTAEPQAVRRTQARYKVPSVQLVRDDGTAVAMSEEIDPRRPVFINFVFTTCASVCPMMSQTFAGLQDSLGADRDNVQLISISIDPENDTPAKLAEYALAFKAGKQWRFYTGPLASSQAIQKAFGVTSLDKMSHVPAIFYRAAAVGLNKNAQWVRLEGFTAPDDLMREFKRTDRQTKRRN